MFKKVLKRAKKGASGRKIAKALKKTKWAKKNPKATKKMAKCLKGIKRTFKGFSIYFCLLRFTHSKYNTYLLGVNKCQNLQNILQPNVNTSM